MDHGITKMVRFKNECIRGNLWVALVEGGKNQGMPFEMVQASMQVRLKYSLYHAVNGYREHAGL